MPLSSSSGSAALGRWRVNPEDLRAVRLGITDAGRSLIDEAFTRSLTVYESMLNELSRAEVEKLETLLAKVLA